jgi:hypothetical protein
MKKYLIIILVLTSQFSWSQTRKIDFPDIQDYQTLVCDLHIHTVFSDGSVWPDIRVQEAILDGVDVIALTEHIEYQPHKEDIPHPDRNRSYEIAKEYAKDKNLIVIHGTEITRSMPPGHANAIFVTDVNKLLIDDPIEAYREANAQGAFVFWNHPHWPSQKPDGVAELTDIHKQLISEGLLHGIEVVNEGTYSDEALAIAQQNDLTIMGTSDIHGLIDWLFDIPGGGHRPVTLVFAADTSKTAIKEALVAGRTVAWFKNNLIGNETQLLPLLNQCLSVGDVSYLGETTVATVEIKNNSQATFMLKNTSEYTFHRNVDLIEVPPHSSIELQVKTLEKKDSFELSFQVLNAITAPATHPEVILKFAVNQ